MNNRSASRDWAEYQRAVAAIATAPADIARRHTENANQTNARSQQAQAELNTLADQHRALSQRLESLDHEAGKVLIRHKVSPAGPATRLADKPVTSMAGATAQADELSEEIATVSARLDELDQARGNLARRALILVTYAAPVLLSALAILLLVSGWRFPAVAAVLVIGAMVVGARKTPDRTTIWSPVIAATIVGLLTIGVTAYSNTTGIVIGYALIAIMLIWISSRGGKTKR